MSVPSIDAGRLCAGPLSASTQGLPGRAVLVSVCAPAIQVPFELGAAEEREITFRLGLGGIPGGDQPGHLGQRTRGAAAARRALEAVWRHWNESLGAVRVTSSDESVNVLCNGWLVYQIISSKLWGRSGYDQSGGAFGFRDQLQDAMALVHSELGLLREQLLVRSAGPRSAEYDGG